MEDMQQFRRKIRVDTGSLAAVREKQTRSLQYKSSLHPEEAFKQLDTNPRRTEVLSPQLVASYTPPLAISQNKKRGLFDMLPLISTHLHSFYRSIKAEGKRTSEIDPDLDEEGIQ